MIPGLPPRSLRTTASRLAGLTVGALGLGWLVLAPEAAAQDGISQADPMWDSRLAEATFDAAWMRIRDTYYDPEMRNLDWDGIREELGPRAAEAGSTEALRGVLGELLARLGESHFSIIPGSSAEAFGPAGGAAIRGDAEPGIDLRWIEGELLVSRIRSGGAAEEAGIRPGWVLESLDGLSIDTLAVLIESGAPPGGEERHLALWLPVAARGRLLGAPGSPVALELRDESGVLRTIELARAPPTGEEVRFGNLPPLRMETSHRVVALPQGKRAGILRMTAWFPVAVPAFATAMEELHDVDGIVLDLRGNPGGLAALAMGIGGYFLDEAVSLGTMRTRDATLQFVVNPQRVTADGRSVDPYGGPLAILVDPLTASTSEVFAGGLQGLGRARVFGEASAGQALPALVSELPNGDRLIHVVADFIAADGVRLEGDGVLPDVYAPPTRQSLLAGADPPLDAALQWIESDP